MGGAVSALGRKAARRKSAEDTQPKAPRGDSAGDAAGLDDEASGSSAEVLDINADGERDGKETKPAITVEHEGSARPQDFGLPAADTQHTRPTASPSLRPPCPDPPPIGTMHTCQDSEGTVFVPDAEVEAPMPKFLVLDLFEYAGHYRTGRRAISDRPTGNPSTPSGESGASGQIREEGDSEVVCMSKRWSRPFYEDGNDETAAPDVAEECPFGLGCIRYHLEAKSTEQYFGAFMRGLPNGSGAHTIRIGSAERTYEGAFRDGLRHGRGVEVVRPMVSLVSPSSDAEEGEKQQFGGEAESAESLWGFYAGGWCKGRRHGFGVEGHVGMTASDESSDRTCFGHRADVALLPEAVVEYYMGVKEHEDTWSRRMPEDEVIWESSMDLAQEGRAAARRAQAIADPVFANQRLLDEARASEKFRREMAEAKERDRSLEAARLAEEERAREAEQEHERKMERQRQAAEALAADKAEEEKLEQERLRKEEEAAAELRLLEGATAVAWPSAMGLQACNRLSLCNEGLVLRRLVEECSTTDPPPRSDAIEDLSEEMALENEREIARRIEARRERRAQDEAIRNLAEWVWENLVEELVAAVLGAEDGFCERAMREVVEDWEEEKGWQEEEDEAAARRADREAQREGMRAARQQEREVARAARQRGREQMQAERAREREEQAAQRGKERERRREEELVKLQDEAVRTLEEVERCVIAFDSHTLVLL